LASQLFGWKSQMRSMNKQGLSTMVLAVDHFSTSVTQTPC
jgi:hypothetical protein